jgi:hypothetical protein
MYKKTIIGCNKFLDNTAISNSNWNTKLNEGLTLNEGDTIAVKTSYVDTRNRIQGYYNVDKDIELEFEYYFYYINRGGNNTPSMYLDKTISGNPFSLVSTKQSIACDCPWLNYTSTVNNMYPNNYLPYGFNTFDDSLKNLNTTPEYFPELYVDASYIVPNPFPNVPHRAYNNTVSIPVTNDKTSTGKVPANISPLLESVYHCFSQNNVYALQDYYDTFDQPAFTNNPSGFNNVLDINSGDGLPYLLHYYIPENVLKNYVPPVVPFSSMVVGQEYTVKSVGGLFQGSLNTNWHSINNTLTTPVVNQTFTCNSPLSLISYQTSDITTLTPDNSFIITESLGFDFSVIGGPAPPDSSGNPLIPLFELELDPDYTTSAYKIVSGITPLLSNGEIASDLYKRINYGINPPFLRPQIGDIVTYLNTGDHDNVAGVQEIDDLSLLSPGMTIDPATWISYDWYSMGYPMPDPIPAPSSASGITGNGIYIVESIGLPWGFDGIITDTPWNTVGINAKPPIGTRFLTSGTIALDNTFYNPNTIINTKDLPTLTRGTGETPTPLNECYVIIVDLGTATNDTWVYLGFDPDDGYPAVNDIFKLNDGLFGDTSGGTVQIIYPSLFTIGLGVTVNTTNNSILQMFSLYNNNVLLTNGEYFEVSTIPTAFNLASSTLTTPLNYTFTVRTTATIINLSITQLEAHSFVVTSAPTTSYPLPPNNGVLLYANELIQKISPYTYPLPAFTPTLPTQPIRVFVGSLTANVVPSGVITTENLQTDVYDNKAMKTGKMVPFTKTFKFILKKGSYSPEYLSEILSRAMSKQKPKKNLINGKIQLSTPTSLINEQMIDKTKIENGYQAIVNNGLPTTYPNMNYNNGSFINIKNQYLATAQPTLYTNYPFSHPYLHQGGFPYNVTGQIDEDAVADLATIWDAYIPNNSFSPKNKNILPSGANLNTTTLPINPRYTQNDYNYNMLLTGDDTPFLMRPGAYGTRSDYDPSTMNIKLIYNDSNLEYLNSTLPVFGKNPDGSIKCIEMAYKPLCHDVVSPYFENIMTNDAGELGGFATEFFVPSTNYSIRPVISAPFSGVSTSLDASTYPNVADPAAVFNDKYTYTFYTPTGTRNISSPIVGSTEMSIVYNQENNGLFSFPYLHTPIYSKPDQNTTQTVESIAIYQNTSYIKTATNNIIPVPSSIQCESQSGILFKSLKAKYVDGSGDATFFEDLGFDVDAITYNPNNDNNSFQIPYDEFIAKTTRAFCGTANMIDSQSKNDFSEVSYASVYDSRSLMGFSLPTNKYINITTGNATDIKAYGVSQNYQLYNEPIYFSVNSTDALNAVNTYTNLNDTGHVLLSIEGYNGVLINEETKLNVKSIISSYYSSANFITNPNNETIVYQHNSPVALDINNLKIVLIDPYTNKEILNIGPNSSVYLEISQLIQTQQTKNNKK